MGSPLKRKAHPPFRACHSCAHQPFQGGFAHKAHIPLGPVACHIFVKQ